MTFHSTPRKGPMLVSQPIAFPSLRCSVFSVSRSEDLLSARQSALESSGMRVNSLTPERAAAFMREARPRVWIFCFTVEMPTLAYLASSIRRYSPASRLLLIEEETPAGVETCLFHRVLSAQKGSDALVSTVRDLALAA